MSNEVFPISSKAAKVQGIRYSSEQNRNAPFPTRLRELRYEKNISQQTLADQLGVVKSTVGQWETGDSLPDARAISKMADFYGVSADYLLVRTDVKSAETSKQAICETTGLKEGSVERLQEMVQNIAANGEDYSKDILALGAIDLLLQNRELLAEIGSYLMFRFDRFELPATEEISITDASILGRGQVLNVVSKAGEAIQLGEEGFHDLLLLNIEKRLRELQVKYTQGAQEREFMEELQQEQTETASEG